MALITNNGLFAIKPNQTKRNEKCSSACSKDRYKFEEGTEVTVNKEIEQAYTGIVVSEDIIFCPRTCPGQLLVDLVTLGSKKLQKRLTVCSYCKTRENSPRVMLQNYFYKIMENGETFKIMVAVLKTYKSLLFLLLPLPESRAMQIKFNFKKSSISKVWET